MNPQKTLAALMTLTALTASATPVTWGFEGLSGGPGLPGGSCAASGCADILLDTWFSGTITFDLAAPDAIADPLAGSYGAFGSPYGIRLQIGEYAFETDYVQIGIQPDPSPLPQYNFFAQQAGPWFTTIGLFNCYAPFSGIVTTDRQLAQPPPVGGACPDPSFLRTVDDFDIALNVSRYFRVPEPGVLSLLGIALIALIAVQRPRRSTR